MSRKFWKDKRVLITGYEGFLGSHLTRRLLSQDARVTGLDIKVRRRQTIFTPDDYKRIHIVRGDVADFPLVKKIIKRNNIEVIFHLAAEALVDDCRRNPRRAFATNIEGTWNILEASRQAKTVRAVVAASSDKAYGSHKKLPYTEKMPLEGDHPYDVSKSCADLLAKAYAHTYGLPVVVTRCGNIFGPGDFSFSRIVPDVMRSIIRGKTLIIRSDGKFTRDYIHVDDIVAGYIVIAEKLRRLKLSGKAFNLSNENPLSVLELVRNIYAIAERKPAFKVMDLARYEIRHQYLSSSKARKVLGWKPKRTLKEGLRQTLEWYRNYLRRNP